MSTKNTTLDDLSSVIGFTATLTLSAWYGNGNNLYVPERINFDSDLVRLIGVSAANALAKEWGGKHIAIPRLSAYEHTSKRRMIARMLEKGFGTREIATHIAMSERRIQQIQRELEVAGLLRPIAKPLEKEPE